MSTKRSSTPTRLFAIGVALATALPLAAEVAAHKFEAATSTTIRYREGTARFRGRVSSTRERCIRRRVVKVVRETESGPVVVGKDRSGREGRWTVSEPNANGAYHAVVKRRFTSDPEGVHIHDCQRGVSATITVSP